MKISYWETSQTYFGLNENSDDRRWWWWYRENGREMPSLLTSTMQWIIINLFISNWKNMTESFLSPFVWLLWNVLSHFIKSVSFYIFLRIYITFLTRNISSLLIVFSHFSTALFSNFDYDSTLIPNPSQTPTTENEDTLMEISHVHHVIIFHLFFHFAKPR